MSETAPTDSPASAPSTTAIDLSRPRARLATAPTLLQIVQATGVPPMRVAMEFLGLALGPGKLSFADYTTMRLFDPSLSKAEKRAFVGQVRNAMLVLQANFDQRDHGLFNNKVAANSFLGAFGLPVIDTRAIYSSFVGHSSATLLKTPEELRAFLRRADVYPLFGKPTDGLQSLGSVSLAKYDVARGKLVATSGEDVEVDALVESLREFADRGGYLFQPRVVPHPTIEAVCGPRLATVRLLTIVGEGGPEVLRGCWKIPAGKNAADNYWRSGNLLAKLDLATGKVLRVVSGVGLELKELTAHPDSGAQMVGLELPFWKELQQAALDGARLFKTVPLIGWDIAIGERGPVIVEMNELPDFMLPQLADGRGILEPKFTAFLAERARLREIAKKNKQL